MFLFYTCINRYHQFYFVLMRLAFLLVLACLSVFVNAQTPPSLQLANVYHSEINVENYWVSEKLDGVRAYWDGARFLS
ncbi:MAG: DNA ligase-1, partial [Oleiphilaceae bacterium]